MEFEKAIILTKNDLKNLLLRGSLRTQDAFLVAENIEAVENKTSPQGSGYHVLIPKHLGEKFRNAIVVFLEEKGKG